VLSTATTIEYITAWATLGTAAATLLLAAGTFWLAWSTREDVKGSKRQVAIGLEQVEVSRRQATAAERAIQGQHTPLLIDVPYGTEREPTRFDHLGQPMSFRDASEVIVRLAAETASLQIGVPLRNVGTGLARVTSLSLEPGFGVQWNSTIPKPNVPAGERARFALSVHPDQAGYELMRALVERRDGFAVSVTYTDAAGAQATITSATLYADGETRWRVRTIDTVAADEGTDPVESAPAHPALP
jgi:hypothetical protein